MTDPPPCKDCESRRAGCHAECPVYGLWKSLLRESKQKRLKAGAGSAAAKELLQQGAIKSIRRKKTR